MRKKSAETSEKDEIGTKRCDCKTRSTINGSNVKKTTKQMENAVGFSTTPGEEETGFDNNQYSQPQVEIFQTFMDSLNDFLKVYKGEENTLLQKGIQYFNEQEYPNALRCFEQVLRINPDNNEARSLLEGCKAIGVLELQRQIIGNQSTDISSLFDKIMKEQPTSRTNYGKEKETKVETIKTSTIPTEVYTGEKMIGTPQILRKTHPVRKTPSYSKAVEKFNVPNLNIFVSSNEVLMGLMKNLSPEMANTGKKNNKGRSIFMDEFDHYSTLVHNDLKKLGLDENTIKIIYESRKYAYELRTRIFQSSNKLVSIIHNVIKCSSGSSDNVNKTMRISRTDLSWLRSERQSVIRILRSGKINKNFNPRTLGSIRTFLKVIKSVELYCETFKEIANQQSPKRPESKTMSTNRSFCFPVFDLYTPKYTVQ